MKVAKDRKSSVLASNAVHHRIDSLTSFVALATIGGSHLFSDASWLDPVGGLLISLMVIRAGWGNTLTSLLELADVTVEDDVRQAVRKAATKAVKGDRSKGLEAVKGADSIEILDIQGTKSGQNYLIDIEVAVPKVWTIQQTTLIENAIRQRIGSKVRGVRRVRIKFTQLESPDTNFAEDFINTDVSPRSSPEPEEHGHHEHDHPSHIEGNGSLVRQQKKTK